MNLFLEMIHAVIRPKSYGTFLKDGKGKTFLFGFVLVLFYFLVTVMAPFVRFQVSTGGIMKMIDQYIPDFTIEDQKVQVSRQVKYDTDGIYVFVDTDAPFIELIDDSDLDALLRVYDRVLVMDSEQAVIKSNSQVREIAFEDIDEDFYMTKETLFESLGSLVNIIIAAGLAIVFVGMELLFFFGVLFVALFGMAVASCMHYHLTFGQLYKLGIYSRTTPLLIKAAISFLPIGVPMYSVISIGISLWYLSAAIRHMKTPALTGGPLSFSSSQTGPMGQDPDPWNHGGSGWNGQTGGNVWSGPGEGGLNGWEDGTDRWNNP